MYLYIHAYLYIYTYIYVCKYAHMYIYSHSYAYEFITFSSPATLLEHDVVVVIFRMLASTCVRGYMHVYTCT